MCAYGVVLLVGMLGCLFTNLWWRRVCAIGGIFAEGEGTILMEGMAGLSATAVLLAVWRGVCFSVKQVCRMLLYSCFCQLPILAQSLV